MSTAKFIVAGQSLTAVNKQEMICGTVNVIECRFDLNTAGEQWDDMIIYASFHNERIKGNYDAPLAVSGKVGTCTIPPKVLSEEGTVVCSLVGKKIEEFEMKVKMTTNIVRFLHLRPAIIRKPAAIDDYDSMLITLKNYIDRKIGNFNVSINEPEDEQILTYDEENEVWKNTTHLNPVLSEQITAGVKVGNVEVGTVFPVGTSVMSILKDILTIPPAPPTIGYTYFGMTDNVPSISLLNNPGTNDSVEKTQTSSKAASYPHTYNNGTSENVQYFCFAYPSSFGNLTAVIDAIGADELSLFTKINDGDYFIYYMGNMWVDEDYKLTFKF